MTQCNMTLRLRMAWWIIPFIKLCDFVAKLGYRVRLEGVQSVVRKGIRFEADR